MSYLEGVLTLNESLKKTHSKYPLVCLLSSNLDIDAQHTLSSYGIDTIQLKEPAISFSANNESRFSNWDFTFDKLKIWGLTQFEKVVFIDSDMIVTKNIDHLFEKPDFSAALAGVLFPTCEGLNFLNSGLVVLTPDISIEQELITIAKELVPAMRQEGKPVGDQDIINAFYPDWFEHKDLILDDGYNLYSRYLQCYIRHYGYSMREKGKPIYIIHYVGVQKPWMVNSIAGFCKMVFSWFPNVYYVFAHIYYKSILRQAKHSKP